MAFIKGKALRIKVNGKFLWHSTDCGISITSKEETIATKDTEGDLVTMSGYNYTLSLGGIYATLDGADATHVTDDALLALQLAGTAIPWQMTSGEVGTTVYSGLCFITQSDISAPTEGNATTTFAFKGSGNIETNVVEA